MARSTIKYLKKLGHSNAYIAKTVNHDPRTVAKVLSEPIEVEPAPRNRVSSVAVFDERIEQWLDHKLQVKRMLELAQSDPEHPYTGKPTAFYDHVRKIKLARQARARQIAVRFEGLPGEYLQIDWGEQRNLRFSRYGASPQTFYFFCARLKYSRFMFVSFQKNMVEETLVHCLLECFLLIGGVPWVVTTDNMKTVVLRRDEKNQPVWNPVWEKLAAEFEFHPEACAPASGNQKGAVENLVKYTENNFLAGRSFYDETDLKEQLEKWLHEVNYVRECQATKEIPAKLLGEEKKHFEPLPKMAADYGMFQSLVVNREGVVIFETNRYSVPAQYFGQTLTARIHRHSLALYDNGQLVALHPRSFERNRRIVIPEHFEKAFEIKPRARVMVYRDWLVALSPIVHTYVAEICHKQRSTMKEQVLQLYSLAKEVGEAEFIAAVELVAEQELYGVEYVKAVVGTRPVGLENQKGVELQPQLQAEMSSARKKKEGPGELELKKEEKGGGNERNLGDYEIFVANLAQLMEEGLTRPTGGAGVVTLAGGER